MTATNRWKLQDVYCRTLELNTIKSKENFNVLFLRIINHNGPFKKKKNKTMICKCDLIHCLWKSEVIRMEQIFSHTWGQHMCWVRQLNSGIPGPLHDSNSASKGNKVMGHCVINRHQTTEFTKYSIYLQVVSDWITYDFQYYCENTVQSLGVKNLCGEKKNVYNCDSDHF